MDVFLVPVGAERYELYCEIADAPVLEVASAPEGRFRRFLHRFSPRRLVHQFREMIAEAERERRRSVPQEIRGGWLARVRARTLRWVAESIAEQRLLWHLRHQTAACLHYPDDLTESDATAILRQQLRRDFDKHRFWLVVDLLLCLAAWPLSFVPGPNFLLYYFLFRIVGHYLSLRGAKCGLQRVSWRHQGSAPLTELRRALALDPGARESYVQAIAQRLHLEHLESFFARSAVST